MGLQWCKTFATEHLIAVQNTNVRDVFGADAGETPVTNGTGKFPTAGDVNAAFLDNRLYLGNGWDQNVRYDGSTSLAALFTAASSQSLFTATATGLTMVAAGDFTIAARVYLNSVGADRSIVGIWDTSDTAKQAFRLFYNHSTTAFRFAVRNPSLVTATVDTAAVTTGQFYTVIAWYDATAGTLNISLNNAAAVTTALVDGAEVIGPTTTPFRVGAVSTAGVAAAFWDGRIDSLGFWQSATGAGGALSADLRAQYHQGGNGEAYTQLSANQFTALYEWWDLEELTGNRVGNLNGTVLAPVASSPTSAAGTAWNLPVAQAMVPKAPSTLTRVSSGTSGLPGSAAGITYQWRVSFLSADGHYGEPCDTPVTIELFAARIVSIQHIPICPAGFDCIGRVLWRSDGGGPYYRLVTIPDNTTTIYVDENSSVSTVDPLVEFNTRFPPVELMVEHQSRLIGARCHTVDGDLKTVYISNVLEPWYCPASPDLNDPNQGTRATLQGIAADEITGLCSHGGVVAAFTAGSGHLLLGVEPNDFRLQKFSDHGCVAHRTIRSVRSLLIWLSPHGVFVWDGREVTWLSEPLAATFQALTALQMSQAYAWVWESRYYIGWPTADGATGKCFYYDLHYHIWGELTNNLWRMATVSAYTASNRERIYAARLGHARILQLEVGTTDAFAPTTISAQWKSKDFDMGLATREKRVQFVETRFKKGTGTAVITLAKGSGEIVQTINHDISVVGNAADTVSKNLASAVEQARDEWFSFDVAIATTAAEVELQAVGCQWIEIT